MDRRRLEVNVHTSSAAPAAAIVASSTSATPVVLSRRQPSAARPAANNSNDIATSVSGTGGDSATTAASPYRMPVVMPAANKARELAATSHHPINRVGLSRATQMTNVMIPRAPAAVLT